MTLFYSRVTPPLQNGAFYAVNENLGNETRVAILEKRQRIKKSGRALHFRDFLVTCMIIILFYLRDGRLIEFRVG